jgi:radical SAM protein with 4Fe4S-binding SPASM domain
LIHHYPNISKKQIENDIDNFLHYLLNQHILTNQPNNGRYIFSNWNCQEKSLSAPRSVFWECTSLCNISSCIHCYSADNKYNESYDFGVSFINQLGEMGVFVIDIGGGEPLIREDLPKLINLANRLGMRCNIATNFSLPKNKLIKFIDSIDNWTLNSIQISIDGHNAELHDKIRGALGWFDTMVDNLYILQDRNIKYRFNCTVMQINLPYIEQIVLKSIELQAKTIRFIRIIPSGRGQNKDLHLTSTQYRDYCKQLVDLNKKYKNIIDVGIDDSFLFLELDKEKYENLKPRVPWIKAPYVGCGAARTVMAVTSNNKVLPCSYLNDNNFIAGDLNTDSVFNIWKTSTLFNDFREQTDLGETCNECFFKSKCLGGCRAAIYGMYGNITSKDPLCWK